MEIKTDPMGADIDMLMFDFVPNIHVDIKCEIAATTKNRKAQGVFDRSRSIRIRRAPENGVNIRALREREGREE